MNNPATPPPAAPANPLADEALLGQLEQDAATAAAPAAPPPPPEIPTAKILEGIFGPAFLIFAPNWQVGPKEVEQLSAAYGMVIDKYFPDGLSQFGPELAAFAITAAVVVPRLNTPMKTLPPKKKPADASPE